MAHTVRTCTGLAGLALPWLQFMPLSKRSRTTTTHRTPAKQIQGIRVGFTLRLSGRKRRSSVVHRPGVPQEELSPCAATILQVISLARGHTRPR
ncbi:protein MpPR1 [Marchantia polymorpha subsp. ruderalis]